MAVVIALAAPLAPRAGAAPADTSSGLTAEIRVGYGGYLVSDVWIPVSVRLRSVRDVAGTVEVTTSHSRPPGTEHVRVDVHLVAGTPFPLTVPAVVRGVHTPLVVRFHQREVVLAEWPVSIPPTRLVDGIVLALTRRPVGLQQVLGESGRVRVAYVTERDLPGRWQLYEGVPAVVLRDFEDRRLVPSQVDALREWIAAGGRLLIAAPTPGVLSRELLEPLLAAPARPPVAPGAPERVHAWGRGQVIVVPHDPFHFDLLAEDAAVWARLLGAPRPAPFVDRTLLDALPQRPGTSLWLQAVIVLTLGLYLALLRPLTRALLGGRAGGVLAAALLAGLTLLGVTLNLAVRRGAATIVQGAVAQGLPEPRLALIESMGRVLLPHRAAFALQASAETLPRAIGGGETTLTLNQMVRFEGDAEGGLPVRSSALVPLAIGGLYREGPQGVEVQLDNRGGHPLRDPIVFLDGRIQPLPAPDKDGRATLSPLRWREPPDVNTVRGAPGRLLAWTFSRLRGDAILSPTLHLVAWLDEDRGVLHWRNQPPAPVLLVLPLSRAEAAP